MAGGGGCHKLVESSGGGGRPTSSAATVDAARVRSLGSRWRRGRAWPLGWVGGRRDWTGGAAPDPRVRAVRGEMRRRRPTRASATPPRDRARRGRRARRAGRPRATDEGQATGDDGQGTGPVSGRPGGSSILWSRVPICRPSGLKPPNAKNAPPPEHSRCRRSEAI